MVCSVVGVGSANESGLRPDCILLDGTGVDRRGTGLDIDDLGGTLNVFFCLCFCLLLFIGSVVDDKVSDKESNEGKRAGDDEDDSPKREGWCDFC